MFSSHMDEEGILEKKFSPAIAGDSKREWVGILQEEKSSI